MALYPLTNLLLSFISEQILLLQRICCLFQKLASCFISEKIKALSKNIKKNQIGHFKSIKYKCRIKEQLKTQVPRPPPERKPIQQQGKYLSTQSKHHPPTICSHSLECLAIFCFSQLRNVGSLIHLFLFDKHLRFSSRTSNVSSPSAFVLKSGCCF